MTNPAEDIFLQALELAEQDRVEFLVRACQGDMNLMREVHSLLEDSRGADAFFGMPPHGDDQHSAGGPFSGERTGDIIGNYRLLHIIGEGGFALVWKAEQMAPITRNVAVKILKAGMDTREVLSRFDAERQALARMEHPNIARVFDAGATTQGRPFFAMEWVDGIPLTTFCEQAALSINERLLLFLDICAAVSHAHQKGIIHRDIKPPNVLVTLDGKRPVVKVIDFGIAKATEGRLTDHTLYTKLEQVLGTPVYMSPEQAGQGGLDVDTRSDIYSLGVLLYELLAGVPPFDTKTLIAAGYNEMRRIVREVEPPRPSTRLTSLTSSQRNEIAIARRVNSVRAGDIIPSDLDWIVMKALEKSRERRYPTADAFAEDMRRFVANEAVTARPPSTWYLLGKFARRHATGLLVAGGVAAVLIASVAFSAWQATRALEAEALAEARLKEVTGARALEARAKEDAEEVARFFRGIFEMPDPETNGRNIKLADALDAAAAKIEGKFAAQPRRRALFEQTLGGTYAKLGVYQPAVASLRKALASYNEAGETDTQSVVETLGELTALLSLLGYYDEAADIGSRHIDLLQKTESDSSSALQEATTIRNQNWFAAGRRDEAIASQAALVAKLETDLAADDPRIQMAKAALHLLRNRAGLELRISPPPGKSPPPSESTPDELNRNQQTRILELEKCLTDAREKYGVDSMPAIEAQSNLALVLAMSGRREEGAPLMRDILEKLTAKYGETHANVLAAESRWAFFLWRYGHGETARQEMRRLLKKRKDIFGPSHLETMMDQASFADALSTQKVYLDEATVLAADAVDVLRKVAGKSRDLHHAMGILSRCYMGADQWWQALKLLEECAPHMPDDTFVNLQLAELQVWFDRHELYEETRARMLASTPRIWGNKNNRPDVYDRIAVLACLTPPTDGQTEVIRSLLRRADELRANPNVTITRNDPGLASLARCLVAYRLGDDAGVQSAYEQSLRIAGSRKTISAMPLVEDLIQAMSLARSGKTTEARQVLQEATPTSSPFRTFPALRRILHREASRLLLRQPNE